MPEHLALGKKNHGDEPVRIVYHAGERTFARLFNESSLEEVKNVVRRKLGLDKGTAVVLRQIKSGKLLDLEDDDDSQAPEAPLSSSPSTDVEIEVTVAAPSATEPVNPSTSKPTEKQPPKPVEASTSTAMTPKRKRAVSFGDVAASGAPKPAEKPSHKKQKVQEKVQAAKTVGPSALSITPAALPSTIAPPRGEVSECAEEPSQKKKKDQAKETVGPFEPPAASTSIVEPPRTEAQTNAAEPVKEKRKREKKVKELQPASVIDLHAKKASDDRLTPGFPTLSTVTMEQHALAILTRNDQWNWLDTKRFQESGQLGRKLEAIIHKLLYFLIVESQKFRGDVLEHFWKRLGTCNKELKLKDNIESLAKQDFVSAEKSFEVLFRGLDPLDPKNVDFKPMLEMAAEFFTHLGVAFVNPGGRKSGTGTVFSASEIDNEETNNLLEQVNKKGDFGKRKQTALKELSFRRDGDVCLLTGLQLEHLTTLGFASELVHIIPNSVHGKSPTLKCIGMFAGIAATEEITGHLNSPDNVMNMELHAHVAYNNMRWGIEARVDGQEVKCFIRMIPAHFNIRVVSHITLKDGDEIRSGTGPDPEEIHRPSPILCNLQLAVARVMRMSGAADIILEWKDRAADEFEGWDGLFIASEEFCDMLDAKLFLSGRAVVS